MPKFEDLRLEVDVVKAQVLEGRHAPGEDLDPEGGALIRSSPVQVEALQVRRNLGKRPEQSREIGFVQRAAEGSEGYVP